MFKKIYVIISGGIDSSFSSLLLRKMGFYTYLLYIKIWKDRKCTHTNNIINIVYIANILKTGFDILDLNKSYKNNVYRSFKNKVRENKSPSIDIRCNKLIKFGKIFKLTNNILKLTSGHYCGMYKNKSMYYLINPLDNLKDQIYFLVRLKTKVLSYLFFPIGMFFKKEIRYIARFMNFINFDRLSTKGICFLEKKKFKIFLINKIIRRRKYINLFGLAERYKYNMYVYKKSVYSNRIYLVFSNDNTLLYTKLLYLSNYLFFFPLSLLKDYYIIKSNLGERYICRLSFVNKYIIKIYLYYPIKKITFGQQLLIFCDNILYGSGVVYNII